MQQTKNEQFSSVRISNDKCCFHVQQEYILLPISDLFGITLIINHKITEATDHT